MVSRIARTPRLVPTKSTRLPSRPPKRHPGSMSRTLVPVAGLQTRTVRSSLAVAREAVPLTSKGQMALTLLTRPELSTRDEVPYFYGLLFVDGGQADAVIGGDRAHGPLQGSRKG